MMLCEDKVRISSLILKYRLFKVKSTQLAVKIFNLTGYLQVSVIA